MFDPRRSDDELRNWADWAFIVVATCLAIGGAIVGVWLSVIANALIVIGAGHRLVRRRARRSETSSAS